MDNLSTLLPRILDLASNFDVDLSNVLSEFARKLRDDAPELMNALKFPEAAMFVQTAADIYGKRVDYVHSLALDLSSSLNTCAFVAEKDKGGNEDDSAGNARRSRNSRKRRTVELTTEDFQLITVSCEKSNTLKKHSKKVNVCAGPICVSSCGLNSFKNEFHVYEYEQFASIGTKDQFMINWPINDYCQLGEYISESPQASLPNSPSYSAEAIETHDLQPEIPLNTEETVPFHSPLPEDPLAVPTETPSGDDQINTCLASQETRNSPCIVENELSASRRLFTPVAHDILKEKALCSKPFKLPYQLTKRGMRGLTPERNYTHFLFSNKLKRLLKMKSALPAPSKNKNSDANLIHKHILFLRERFDLDNREFCAQSLIQQETDFLGFEQVFLPDVPEVLTAFQEEQENVEIPYVAAESAHLDTNGREIESDNGENNCCDTQNDDVGLKIRQDPILDFPTRQQTIDAAGVDKWRQNMQVKLRDEESRRSFDVHAYGSDVINAFDHSGQTLSFGDLVGGLDSREVSRYFLASMMLANTSNLSIEYEGVPNAINLTLQHTERSHDLEDFLVPAAATGRTSRSKR